VRFEVALFIDLRDVGATYWLPSPPEGPESNAVKDFDVAITSTKRQRVDLPKCRRIHSLALRATNGQNVCTTRRFPTQLNSLADWGIGHRNVWKIGEDRNDGGTIVIHSDPSDLSDPERHRGVWVAGEASARLVSGRRPVKNPSRRCPEGRGDRCLPIDDLSAP
jgi:hypothetical protein